MAAAASTAFDTGHEEMIHDVAFDYYGRRLATASSDRTVRVFEVVPAEKQQQQNQFQNQNQQFPNQQPNQQQQQQQPRHRHLATLQGHDGPVWSVSWAHPQFGSMLASCSYDRKVIVWKEEQRGRWARVLEDSSHEASVNCISWAPHAYGLRLAAASADGAVTIFSYDDTQQRWNRARVNAHPGGVNAVSWAPAVQQGALLNVAAAVGAGAAAGEQAAGAAAAAAKGGLAPARFVTGGCDNTVRIWGFDEQKGAWSEQQVFEKDKNRHGDWVRDVAWAPSVGLPTSTIASCSEDRTVAIWVEDGKGTWRRSAKLDFDQKPWRVSWSQMGNVLAVSQADNKVSLFKESLDGRWTNLSAATADDEAAAIKAQPNGVAAVAVSADEEKK